MRAPTEHICAIHILKQLHHPHNKKTLRERKGLIFNKISTYLKNKT